MEFVRTNRDWLLLELLGCSEAHMEMLEDVIYDWSDILRDSWDSLFDTLDAAHKSGGTGLNKIMELVVLYGAEQMDYAVQDRVCELEAIPNEREIDEDEEKELHLLRTLNPVEDIRGFFNDIDTHVWFEQNRDIYCRYLKDALKAFEKGTGLWFEGIDTEES